MGIHFFKLNGLKQNPKCIEFHITPVLTFTQAPKNELKNIGSGWSIALEWGHWAIGFVIYQLK